MNELLKKVEKAIEEQPYARFLGLKAEQAEEGKVVVSFAKKAELLQQTGTLHGGVIGGVSPSAPHGDGKRYRLRVHLQLYAL